MIARRLNPTQSVATGLVNRVRLLGVLVAFTVLSLLVVSLAVALQGAQSGVTAIARDTAKQADLFLSSVQADLLRVGQSFELVREEQRVTILRDVLRRNRAIFQISVVSDDGRVMYDRRRVGTSQTGTILDPVWKAQTSVGQVYISPTSYNEFEVPTVTLAVPLEEADVVTGALVARIELTALWSLVVGVQAGENGYAYLVDKDDQLLAYRDVSLVESGQTLKTLTERSSESMTRPTANLLDYVVNGLSGETVLYSATPLSLADWVAVVEIPLTEPVQQILPFAVLLVVAATVALYVVFSSSQYTTRRIVKPLQEVSDGVKQIQGGNLAYRIPQQGEQGDEIHSLTNVLNDVASELNTLIAELETRVATRTRDLELSAEVSAKISSLLDLDSLLTQITALIRESFRFEQVSVFIYDEATRALQLKGSDGIAGEIWRKRTVSFPIDGQGVIALAARTGETVIVNDTNASSDYLRVEELSTIQSELTIPIHLGGQLIGVLDLQSDQKDKFGTDELRALRPLAEQIAVAVENARLYSTQRQLIKDLQAADQMKSQFLASMSHELRTPLNAILNFTRFNMMGIYGELNERQKSSMEKIVSSAQHLLSLINDVLDIAKIEANMMQLFVEDGVDLNAELTSVVATAETLLADREGVVRLITDIDPNIPTFVGDRRRVRQIVLNLVSNACKFTEEGSVTISAKHRGDDVHIAVFDTGPGIPADKLDLIFEPFQQTEAGIKHAGGTGLGLPIAKRLTEAHHGRIWVETTVNEGCAFHVILPLRHPQTLAMLKAKTETNHV